MNSLPEDTLRGRTVTLGVTGSIAAYKAVLVARLLVQAGARVRVVLTAGALRFVGASTFSGVTSEPVYSDMFDATEGGERHVVLGKESDLVLVVPATADVLSRFASGRADDLLTATVLCARCPVLVAPAMHPSMWDHAAVRKNVATLGDTGHVRFIGPVEGEVASGERGMGRMAEPADIVEAAARLFVHQDLAGRHVVVTAGPTVEDIDPVRFISNRSSGKMGFAIAERAAARGARVTLIAGPVSLATPRGVARVDVRSALGLQKAMDDAMGADLSLADALVMSAAVGDYRPAKTLPSKLKREKSGDLSLTLVQNPDLLSEVGRRRRGSRPLLVGFAVETGTDREIVRYARDKLKKKRVDAVVANHAAQSMGRDDNRVLLVDERAVTDSGVLPKSKVADRVLDWVAEHLPGRRPGTATARGRGKVLRAPVNEGPPRERRAAGTARRRTPRSRR